jgi:hypothetical protein
MGVFVELLFFAFALTIVAEAFGKRVVVDFQLCDLLVLVGRDRNELGLLEDERLEFAPRQLENVALLDNVEARLVLVHRVQDGLHKRKIEKREPF